MDFVFGTLLNDDLKLVDHRANRRGLQHGHDIHPRDPLPGQPVTVRVVTSDDTPIDALMLRYSTNGSAPAGGQAVAFAPVRIEWDTLVWGYLTHWEAVIPGQPDGVIVRYIISGQMADGKIVYADYPDVKATVEHAARAFFGQVDAQPDYTPGDPAAADLFAYAVDTHRAPPAQQAVIYHLMVDRFYPGDGHDWRQTDDLTGFCGGTLWGVRDKLDYLAALNVDYLWLSPVWCSPSAHGYDVTDYEQVEPRLGGDSALHALVAAAHARGIRVLLDMACNHLSNQHPYFIAAQADPASPYRDWFIFDDSPLGYRAFFGVAAMPELNLAHPPARDWMIDVAARWLRDFDIDGYRLDYAHGPGPGFWAYFRAACKQVRPDCLLFGEIIDAPDKLLRYIGRLDGCLNFSVSDALRRTFGWRSWPRERCAAFVAAQARYFPPDFVMPTFLDNHDMDRFSFIAGGDDAALRAAAAYQMALPQPAVICYGSEVGVVQRQGTREAGLHVSREPMPWGDAQDADLLAYYRALTAARMNL